VLTNKKIIEMFWLCGSVWSTWDNDNCYNIC